MAKFNLKEHIAKNKATFFGSLTEGQFSWMTQDTGQQIGSQEGNTIPVYMFDNTGKYWFEKEYEGYGVFGGKDYYELLDQMNGGIGDRSEGVRKAFDPTSKGKLLFPALVVGASNFNYKTHDFTQEAEHDPNQSWLSPEEEEDYDMDREEDYDYSDYDYSDGEELEEGKAAYEYEKGKEAGEKIEKKKMKKSELKAKIKEMIVAEMDGPAEVAKEYDFLAELESMLNEAEGLTPLQDYVYQYEIEISGEDEAQEFLDDIKKLNTPQDVYDYYAYDRDWSGSMDNDLENIFRQVKRKFKNLNEADEEADAEATDEVAPEEVDTTVDVTTDEVDPNVKDVQDALTQAQAAAQKLGDPKLTDQIGNTITFFTRSHVVEKPTGAVTEADEIESGNMQYVLDWWEELPFETKKEIFHQYQEAGDAANKYKMNESMFPILKKILK
jgi:hypothetical protein